MKLCGFLKCFHMWNQHNGGKKWQWIIKLKLFYPLKINKPKTENNNHLHQNNIKKKDNCIYILWKNSYKINTGITWHHKWAKILKKLQCAKSLQNAFQNLWILLQATVIQQNLNIVPIENEHDKFHLEYWIIPSLWPTEANWEASCKNSWVNPQLLWASRRSGEAGGRH